MDFKDKKRIVIKIGSNSLMHKDTGKLDYVKIEQLVREICDLRNQDIDVVLVSSGAIAIGRQRINYEKKPGTIAEKQALAAIGQARLMSIYQSLFSEYNTQSGQVLMTKNTMLDNVSRKNAQNTLEQLLEWGIVPVVNENDTVSTFEIQLGDNDTLSAMVAALVKADLLILLSDIDGLYSANPKNDPNAVFIERVDSIDESIEAMASDKPGSDVGTGGMSTKIHAATIATSLGCDMVLAGADDMAVIHDIIEGSYKGTHFVAGRDEYFDILDYLEQ